MSFQLSEFWKLLLNLDNNAGTDSAATLTDSEAQALLDCDRGDELDLHVDVIAGHAHLSAFGKGDDAGNVGGAEIELGTVVIEERGMTAAFVLGQNINLTNELGVGLDGAGSCQNLATLYVLLCDTAKKSTYIVACLCVLEDLVEHLGTGNGGLGDLVLQADDLNLVANLDAATLYTAGGNSAAAGNGEYVLDRHKERLVCLAIGSGDPGIDCIHELLYACILGSIGILGLAYECIKSGTADDGGIVSGEAVEVEQLTNFHLDELEELFVVDLIALVQEYEDGRNVNLAGEQEVLTSLSHGTVGCCDNEDSAVHLSCAGDHVLDIVSVTRAVNVCIMTMCGLVLDVGGVDGDTALSLLRSLVDGRVIGVLCVAEQGQVLGDSCGQSGLAMVNVTNGADIDVGQGSVELLLCHNNNLREISTNDLIKLLAYMVYQPLRAPRRVSWRFFGSST